MFIYDDITTTTLYNLDSFHEIDIGETFCVDRNSEYYDRPNGNQYCLVLTSIDGACQERQSTSTVREPTVTTAIGPAFRTKSEAEMLFLILIKVLNAIDGNVIRLSDLMRR